MADAAPVPCRWCGETHGPLCHWVKAIEFDATYQTVTRVEFVTAVDFPQQKINGAAAGAEPPDYETLKPFGARSR